MAVGRSARGAPRSALDHPYGSYGFQYCGMGGLVTNVWDLWRFDRALQKGRILKTAAKEALFEPGLRDYALGWFVRKDRAGRLVQSHTGSVRGFLADVRRYPEEDGCLFILTNRDDAPLGRIASGVEEILFGGAPALLAAKPGPIDAELAEALVGHYAGADGRGLFVTRAGAVVRFELRWVRPAGAVTRGTIGRAASGSGLVFDDGAGTYEVAMEREAGKPVAALVWDGVRFSRKD